MKLVKLDLRKNNLKPYLHGVLGIMIAIMAIGLLFCAVPVLEPNDPYSNEFSDPNMIITMVSILSMCSFSILSSIMHSKFVVEEYTGRKNVLLFYLSTKKKQHTSCQICTYICLCICNDVCCQYDRLCSSRIVW